MSEAVVPLFELEPLTGPSDIASDVGLRQAAHEFCQTQPYRRGSYGKRNWGGLLHSLCSYQGKLKPSIAHFLVAWFTERGQVVLDPMAGVGTIPLEARRQGRVGIGGDLSELAYAVTKAKLEVFDGDDVVACVEALLERLATDESPLESLKSRESASFGLNGKIEDYFAAETLREVLLARGFFRDRMPSLSAGEAIVLSSLLHILHGNRPYALSRRSHPVTPLKPTGPFVYRSLAQRLLPRVQAAVTELSRLDAGSTALRADLAQLPRRPGSVDAVITSPPFSQSLRFFSSNWMRLWFCGWEPSHFKTKPDDFLERQQKTHFQASYSRFSEAMAKLLRPGGLLIAHVGETATFNMAEALAGVLGKEFRVVYSGRECVADTESHGLSDKGATRAHHFLFARRR